MKISPSVKVDELGNKRLPPSPLLKREQTSFPVHPVDARFFLKRCFSISAVLWSISTESLMLFFGNHDIDEPF
jgi:hypothetical protein